MPQSKPKMSIPTPFRFSFSPEFAEHLETFAKMHQYDDRHTFKDAWKEWSNENPILQTEVKHLIESGFEGDILDKMFKSARYYYRKKPETPVKQPNPNKQYIPISIELRKEMDHHIQKSPTKISPANSYAAFCKEYATKIEEEIHSLTKKNVEDPETKIKKTYKNRYCIFSTQSNHAKNPTK
jgi:hypothetical protein